MVFGPANIYNSILRPFSVIAFQSYQAAGMFSVAYVTVPNETTGKELAHKLVTAKLAACVNIVPKITSVYEWQGKIEEDSEAMLIIKTRASRVGELTEFVNKNHPYDVPEVITLPIQSGSPQYLDWLANNVPEK